MNNVVKFPVGLCTSCGAEARDLLKIELVNYDTSEAAGTKYLCRGCRPLDEDGLRLLLDQRDAEISVLRGALLMISRLEDGSRGAYSKFAMAKSVAKTALTSAYRKVSE